MSRPARDAARFAARMRCRSGEYRRTDEPHHRAGWTADAARRRELPISCHAADPRYNRAGVAAENQGIDRGGRDRCARSAARFGGGIAELSHVR